MQDTIYALSSGHGRSAVALVRVSGPLARKVFSVFGAELPEARMAALRRLVDPRDGDVVDQALTMWFPEPRSFTGEDLVELHVHGGRAVLEAVFDVLGEVAGFRLADPGEFTRRAFENGKLTLTDAEGIADLIDADTKLQRKHALWLMSGGIAQTVAEWRTLLLDSLSLVEACIDFPDEGEVSHRVLADVALQVQSLASSLRQSLERKGRSEILREGFIVLIVGRPNAGKSTLLNALVQREAAITSEVAGTTRDLIEVKLDVGGLPVILVDTAGLHTTTDPVETKGIERTRARAKEAHLVLWLSSVTDPNEPAGLDEISGEVVHVSSMADLGAPAPNTRFSFSSVTGEGLSDLLEFIGARARDKVGVDEPGVVLLRRHYDAAADTLSAVNGASGALARTDLEIVAEELRAAVRHLGRLSREIEPDEVLDQIFGRFCLGK